MKLVLGILNNSDLLRRVPYRHKSVPNILFSINIELINLFNVQTSSAVLFVEAVSQFSFTVAQILACLVMAQSFLICQIVIGISISKLLLVTHFYWIFPLDPYKLARSITMTATAVAVLPCAVVGTYKTRHGQLMNHRAAYLAGLAYQPDGLPVLDYMALFWTLLAIFTLTLTIYIPHKLQQQQAVKGH